MTRVRNFASATAYFLEKNRGRAVLLFGLLTVFVLLNSMHALIDAVIGLVGFLPAFAIQLSFAVVFIGAQFFMMFYWLSRPRKYVTRSREMAARTEGRRTIASSRRNWSFAARPTGRPPSLSIALLPTTTSTVHRLLAITCNP